jgi:electron transfer flavoprotein alpha subunit
MGYRAEPHSRPSLETASVVVAGGRTFGSADNFERLIGGLADALGGAVGATGGAVAAGFASADHQIGQSGKTVAPDVYIAAGISGADQHVGGMRGSNVIVAINSDPSAAIFRVADYALVADVNEALPELTAKLSGKR